MVRISGGCHCRNIRLSIDWPESDLVIGVRHCGCSFCRKHGGAWASNREAVLEVTVMAEALTTRYAFGTDTADFYVCQQCGIVPVVVSNIDGSDYAVVNVNTFDSHPKISFTHDATDFAGEKTSDRLARRRGNWIHNVSIASGISNECEFCNTGQV